MGMDAKAAYPLSARPLIARLEGMNGDAHGWGNQSDTDTRDGDGRLLHLIGQFLRGGKDKRRSLLQAAQQGQAEAADQDAEDEGGDRYEPQRLTRKIHWQYDRSMKKVPMLRRDYIA